ncbi:MAG: hypothetical protein E7552_05385 [Ruminococcaceae bacterium]|nr:hypothetical protein [Oscillospiraceae bacterium]
MGLLDLLKKLPSVNELKGGLGEQLAKHYAKTMTDTLVLHDILIDGSDEHTSQIDLLMIGSKGIYVAEVKMFSEATIYGDGKRSKWYYYAGGSKYEIYSPLKQNAKHIEYLKEFLKDFGDIPCFSIVTIICRDLKVSNINPKGGEIQTVVCNSLPAMKRAMQLIAKDKPAVWDNDRKQAIFDYIQSNQYVGKDARLLHKQNVIAYKERLENTKAEKICPHCKTPLVLRKGKYGEFYGCSNFPKCRYTLK